MRCGSCAEPSAQDLSGCVTVNFAFAQLSPQPLFSSKAALEPEQIQ
jgi:hypothetical protein